MTTLYFLQRLLPFLPVTDLTTLDAGRRLALVGAINAGLKQWEKDAPVSAKTYPTAATFRAAREITLDATEDSTTIASGDITSDDLGCSLLIDGDTVPNTLTSTTSLRLPYAGTTGSGISATLYGDAAPLPANYTGITGPVWAEWANERRQITPVPDIRRTRWSLYGTLCYGIEQTRLSTGSPVNFLRLYPAPTTDLRVSFDYYGPPRAWNLTDLIKSRTLDLDDTQWENIVWLVADILPSIPGLANESLDQQRVALQSARAGQHTRLTPPSANQQPITLGTPNGF